MEEKLNTQERVTKNTSNAQMSYSVEVLDRAGVGEGGEVGVVLTTQRTLSWYARKGLAVLNYFWKW